MDGRIKSGFGYHATSTTGPTTGSARMNDLNALSWGTGTIYPKTTPSNANSQDVYIVADPWDGGSAFSNHNGLFGGTTSSESGLHGNSDSPGNSIGSGWFNQFYLNGSVSTGSGVLTDMNLGFIASIAKDSPHSITGYKVGFDRVWGGHGDQVQLLR